MPARGRPKEWKAAWSNELLKYEGHKRSTRKRCPENSVGLSGFCWRPCLLTRLSGTRGLPSRCEGGTGYVRGCWGPSQIGNVRLWTGNSCGATNHTPCTVLMREHHRTQTKRAHGPGWLVLGDRWEGQEPRACQVRREVALQQEPEWGRRRAATPGSGFANGGVVSWYKPWTREEPPLVAPRGCPSPLELKRRKFCIFP